MNNNLAGFVNRIIDESESYLDFLTDLYGIDVAFHLFAVSTRNWQIDDLYETEPTHFMMKIGVYGTRDDTGVYTEIRGIIHMSYETLYQLIIECCLDEDDIIESMKMSIKHEVGHALVWTKEFIGKTIEQVSDIVTRYDSEYASFPSLRKNASDKSRLQYYLDYNFNISAERMANDAVGLTKEHFIKDYERRHKKRYGREA